MPAILSANAAARPTVGAHICGMFTSETERRALTVAFVRQGVTRGDRLLLVTDRRGMRELLEAEHLACGEAFASGRVAAISPGELYLRDGVFRPGHVLHELRAAARRAVADGYPGLRVVADMDWARGSDDAAALAAYERRAGAVFSDGRLSALCLYDTTAFGQDVLAGVRDAHPLLGEGQAPGSPRPTLWAVPSRDALRLAGEVDLASAKHLASLVRAHAGEHGRLVLDLSGLRFIDVHGLRALAWTARGLPDPQRLVLRGASGTVRKALALLGWDRPPYLVLDDDGEDGP